MQRLRTVAATGLAPAIWGSTYLVTAEWLPAGHPITLAVLRALPAGLLLLAWTGRLPPRAWLWRIGVLGGLNFAVFWTMLYVAAHRLPGGVAATVASVQALMVIGLSRGLLGTPIRARAVLAAAAGVAGVALLVLGPPAALDPLGIAAGVVGAAAMATGTVLSRRWQPPVPVLTFTAWQLTAGGLLLVPAALWLEPALPPLDVGAIAGLAWLGLVGAALTYGLWFRGISRLEPTSVAMLALLSPLTAVILGWVWRSESLTGLQLIGLAIVLGSVVAGQSGRRRPSTPATPSAKVPA